MDWLQTVTLALVQGLTEFLPVSSSAHLILAPRLLGWPDQGQAFDVAVHVGTLAAVVSYFHRELGKMLRDWLASLAARRAVGHSSLAWGVFWGTFPAGLTGVLAGDQIELFLRSPLVIAAATIGFGLVLWWASVRDDGGRDEFSIGWRDVLIIGCAQALALIPGTSRSGITITAGLLLGLRATAAARFSFLLSVPIIAAAGLLHTLGLIQQGASADWAAVGVGALVAALSAFACIHAFLKLLERIGMLPFIVYRLILGAALVVLFW
ncbi:MAG: undecaprenyl-diphosphate phosphatase [Pseudomonadota bacterium]